MALWGKFLVALFLLIQVYADATKHNLPDNLEIVDPKSLGLAGADIDKFLGNVKLLPITGNGLLPKDPHTKTQILTVGFDGDEGLNLDDFELPSVDGLPDAEKTVAQAAFSRFQEFFKNPSKSKLIVEDEDLIDDKHEHNNKQPPITTTTPSPTTIIPVTTPGRRPVYRPRTPALTTTSHPKITRTRKIKRPGAFRRTTTTPQPTTTEIVSELPTQLPALYSSKKEEFKPEQFQDYASVIRDLQKVGPRVGATGSGSEGAPNQFLGFKQVNDPGHKGPPIFEFGSSSSSSGSSSSNIGKTVKYRPVPVIASATTERQENTQGSSQVIDFSKPNGGFNTHRFKPSPLIGKVSSSVRVSNSPQPEVVPGPIENDPAPTGRPTVFEQISAEPIGSSQHSSLRVPFRFPNDENKQAQFEQIYEHHVNNLPPTVQQPLEPQSPTVEQAVRPTVQPPTAHVINPVPASNFGQRIPPSQSEMSDQLRMIQEQYAKQQREQAQKFKELEEQLNIQREKSLQLQEQLKLQEQHRQQEQQRQEQIRQQQQQQILTSQQQFQQQKQQQQQIPQDQQFPDQQQQQFPEQKQQQFPEQKQQQFPEQKQQQFPEQKQQQFPEQKQQQFPEQKQQQFPEQKQQQFPEQKQQQFPEQKQQQFPEQKQQQFPEQKQQQFLEQQQQLQEQQQFPGQPQQFPGQQQQFHGQQQQFSEQQKQHILRQLQQQFPTQQLRQQQQRPQFPQQPPQFQSRPQHPIHESRGIFPPPQGQPLAPINFPPRSAPPPFHRSGPVLSNVQPGIFIQPNLLPNQNFLRPHINEKFLNSADRPKHVVPNPIGLFPPESPGSKAPPQLFTLSAVENVVQPNFAPNRFALPRPQQPSGQVAPFAQQRQPQQGPPLVPPQNLFGVRSFDNAEQRSFENAGQLPFENAEQRSFENAEQRSFENAEQRSFENAEQRSFESSEPSFENSEQSLESAEQRPSESAEQRTSDIAVQQSPAIPEQRPSPVAEQRPSDIAEQRSSDIAEQRPSPIAEQRPSDKAEQRPFVNAKKDVASSKPAVIVPTTSNIPTNKKAVIDIHPSSFVGSFSLPTTFKAPSSPSTTV